MAPALTFARRHWLFLVLLAAAAGLRLVTLLAYRPALIYFDSTSYLDNVDNLVPQQVRPIGYALFLSLLPLKSVGLMVIPFLQHGLGLATGVLIYALMLRLGVRPWAGALAAAPVLLDAYQLNIEEYILSESLYELLIVAGCALILWRRRPAVVPAALAGLLFAVAAATRVSGLVIVLPGALALAFLGRRRLWPLGAFLAAFAIPIAAYMIWFHSLYGTYSLTSYGGRFLYARVAPFANCSELSLPAYERVLCPQQPLGHRLTVEQYMWGHNTSPVYRLHTPRGKTRPQVAGSFAKRVIVHQPFTYARVVAHDFLRAFAWGRHTQRGELPVARWQFQNTFPIFRKRVHTVLRKYEGGPNAHSVRRPLTHFLRRYQSVAFTPGPLLALGLVAGLLAALGLGRARRSGLRTAAFLFTAGALAVYVPSVAANQFTWRYQLPLLVLLPPAAAVGLTALLRRRERPRRRVRPDAAGEAPTAVQAPGPDGGVAEPAQR